MTIIRALSEAALAFARHLSPTSTPTSLPPSTTPDPSPAPDPMSMMTTLREMLREEREETRKLVMGLVYPALSTGGPTTDQSPSDPLMVSPTNTGWEPYDAMPLSPELEQVAKREAEEAELQRLLRERAVFQGRLRELQEEEARLTEEAGSSLGPWVGARSDEASTS